MLAVREPMTVAMVREVLPDTTTVAQAMPQMWKRGVLVRRREEGRNTYWYARSVEAFARPIDNGPVKFTDSERCDRDEKWAATVAQIAASSEAGVAVRNEGEADASTPERPDGIGTPQEDPEPRTA